jgi:hypothetical protein
MAKYIIIDDKATFGFDESVDFVVYFSMWAVLDCAGAKFAGGGA